MRNSQINKLKSDLETTQKKIQSSPMDLELVKQEFEARSTLHKLYSARDLGFRQKANIAWLKDGDANSKFFHATIRARQAANSMKKVICRDEIISEDPKVIREQAILFYYELFNSIPGRREQCPHVPFKKVLNNDGRQLLDRPFSIDELQCVVQRANPDKAPRPNGFTIGFFNELGISSKMTFGMLFYFSIKEGSLR